MKRVYTPVKKKTILVVEDDQVIAHIYREQFHRQGFRVEVAGDADSAMQKLRKEPIDLVILDLCLPATDGVEVLKNIRSEIDRTTLPIIAFANAYLTTLARAASEAGATKCLTKDESTLAETVELVRELLAPNAASESIPRPATGPLALQSETDLQEKLAATLLVNAPEMLTKLRASHQFFARTEDEDSRRTKLSEMHRQLRSLAGAAGFVGLSKIARMTSALEALLIDLHAKPQKITPSVVRTVAQAVDILASLFNRAANPPAETTAPAKVLVVDDEVISREMICSALGKAGLQAESLEDPFAAQHLLEQNHFDLIFLDVEMPGQTGLELCVKIREMAPNRATPIVFVTSHSDFGSRAQSTLSGGNDFIAKPFLLVELAVKALIWLFKESPAPLSAATTQNISLGETIGHESPAPLLASHVVSAGEESAPGLDTPSQE